MEERNVPYFLLLLRAGHSLECALSFLEITTEECTAMSICCIMFRLLFLQPGYSSICTVIDVLCPGLG